MEGDREEAMNTKIIFSLLHLHFPPNHHITILRTQKFHALMGSKKNFLYQKYSKTLYFQIDLPEFVNCEPQKSGQSHMVAEAASEHVL